MNNSEINSLIVNDLKELLLLFEGMSELSEIPVSVLNLASVKVERISSRINDLTPKSDNQEFSLSDDSDCAECREEEFGDEGIDHSDDEIYAGESGGEDFDSEDEYDDEDEFDDDEYEEWEEEEADEDEEELNFDELSEELSVELNEFGTNFASDLKNEASEDVLQSAQRDKTSVSTKTGSKRLESRFVVSLKKMGIVDRYRYGKELFGGDVALLSHTIDILDGMDSLDDAMAYIHDNFTWDEQNPAVADFLVLLENRFS